MIMATAIVVLTCALVSSAVHLLGYEDHASVTWIQLSYERYDLDLDVETSDGRRAFAKYRPACLRTHDPYAVRVACLQAEARSLVNTSLPVMRYLSTPNVVETWGSYRFVIWTLVMMTSLVGLWWINTPN